jgi:hypothetical protein
MNHIRKSLLYLGFVALTIGAVQPALAYRQTGIVATVNTDSGVNLMVRVAPDGNSRVLEAVPSGTQLQVIGMTVMDTVTVNVPKAVQSGDDEPATEPKGTPVAPASAPIANVHPSAQVSPVPVSNSNASFLVGYLDTFSAAQCEAGGWALDTDHPTTGVVVSIYRDAAAGDPAAVPIGTFATDVSRPDVNAAKHATGPHGFLVQFGANSGMYDHQSHRIYAYAVGANGATISLNASGAPITCTGAAPQAGAVIDQMWIYVSHAVNGGSIRGWVNARYVDLTDSKNNNKKLALPGDRRTLPVTDPTTVGMAIGVAAPGAGDNSGVTEVSDIKTAKSVMAAIGYGTHLAIHMHPYLASHVIGFVDSGTVLTTCGTATDNENRLWVCVNAPSSANWASHASGYALGSMLDTVDNAAVANAAQPQADALTAPLQPDAKAQVDNTANSTEPTTEPSQNASQPTQVAPQDTPVPTDASQQALATPVQIDPPAATPAATQATVTGG